MVTDDPLKALTTGVMGPTQADSAAIEKNKKIRIVVLSGFEAVSHDRHFLLGER